MMFMKKLVQKIPFHLLFFICYPIFSLYVTNRNQIPTFSILRSSLFILGLSVAVFLVVFLLARDFLKAALLTSVFNILFNSYGHIYQAIDQVKWNGVSLARHSLLTVFWIAIGVAAVLLILKLKENIFAVTQTINLVGGFLVVIVLSQLMIARINGDIFAVKAKP